MDAASPFAAAFGVTGFDLLNDLAHWLDGDAEPAAVADNGGRTGRWADQVRASGREG